MTIILSAVFLLAPVLPTASNISVGGRVLTIPNPPGFGRVTPQMATVHELQIQMVGPTTEQLVAFIPDAAVSRAVKGDLPDLTRWLSVQTPKALVSESVSTSHFAQVKAVSRSQNDDIVKKIEKDLPGLMGQINKQISKQHDVDLALAVSQIVPLPIHDETDHTFAFSAFVKYDAKDASGDPVRFVVVFTTTIVHVKGKILFLYCYADEAGLEWSRRLSSQWASAVVAANPPD